MRWARRAGVVALVVGAASTGRTGDAEPADAERFVSPIERRTFVVERDEAAGRSWLRGEDGATYATVHDVVAAEAAGLTRFERVVARELWDAATDDRRSDERLAVVIRLRRQPVCAVGGEVRHRQHAALQRLVRDIRALNAAAEERRAAAPESDREPQMESFLSEAERDELRAARRRLGEAKAAMRDEVLATARPQVAEDQARLVAFLEAQPEAKVTARVVVLNAVCARVPARLLGELVERFPEIARIERSNTFVPCLTTSPSVVGAGTWWTAGLDGSTSTRIAVLDTGVDRTHPALSGVLASSDCDVFLDNAAEDDALFTDDETDPDDAFGHGTHVAGIVGNTNLTYNGVAPGSRLISAKCGYTRDDDEHPAAFQLADAFLAAEWAVDRSATAFNLSWGSAPSADADGANDATFASSLYFDALTWGLSIPVAVASGNTGADGAGSVGRPADAFNVIAVGNFDDRGSTSIADDNLATSSSRGPTADGRRKPDLCAPGTAITSCSATHEGSGADWVSLTGTSMASPHVAGALALLDDYGAAATPWGFKALLLATCNAPWGSSGTPDNAWGAGVLDMARAYQCRASVHEGELTSSGTGKVFLKLGTLAFGSRAALVWPRSVEASDDEFTYLAPPDLNLYLYDENSRTVVTSSISSVDNVEIATFGAWSRPCIAKVVRYANPASYSVIPYAVASECTSSAGPTVVDPPSLSITVSGVPAVVGPGQAFWLTTTVSNSGDIGAGAVDLPITIPSGYGSDLAIYGTGWVDGGDSSEADAYIIPPSGPSGPRTFTFQARSDIYGENYASNVVTIQQMLDATPPSGSVVIQDGAAYTNTRSVVVTTLASDAHSSVTGMAVRDFLATPSTYEAYADSKAFNLFGSDGVKVVYAYYRDQVGNVSAPVSDTIVLDTTPPTGSITVAGGAAWTNAASVALTLAASDATSGVESMRFSNDGTNWSAWQAFASSAAWTLTAGEGSRTVRVQYRDVAGNVSSAFSDGIAVDLTPPTCTLVIAGGASWTRDALVSLAIGGSDALSGVAGMRASLDGIVWSAWYPFAPSATIELDGADGAKAVHLQVRDAAGNVSATTTDTIGLDTVGPVGSLSIAAGAAWTRTAAVALSPAATDATSGVDAMRFSDDGQAWTAWQSYAAASSWTLPGGDGAKTVHAQFRDVAGNVSAAASDDVGLDRVAPTGSVVLAGGAAWTNVTTVEAALAASDATSGVEDMRLSSDGTNWEAWTAFATTAQRTLLAPDGVKWVVVQFRDAAGNVSADALDSIGLDTTPPTASVTIAGGAAWTNAAGVTLALSTADAGSGVAQMRISDDGSAWTTWSAYAAFVPWTLLPGDGAKSVHVQVRDVAGNASLASSDSIGLDTTSPAASLTIDGGAAWTTAATVTLSTSASDAGSGPEAVRFRDDGVTWSAWVPFTTSRTWTLSGADGAKTVEAQVRDLAQNVSAVVADGIGLDRVAPAASVVLAGGAAYTNLTSVTAAVSASDATSGVHEMRLSADGATWGTWASFAASVPWPLASPDGTKAVHVQVRDLAGNVSATGQDAIVLDTTPPTGTVVVNADAVWTNAAAVTLTVTGSDAGSGVARMQFRNANPAGDWSSWSAFSSTAPWTLSSGDGAKSVELALEDGAGNSAIVGADGITLDTTPPTGTVAVNAGAPWTNDRAVTLTLQASDATSGVVTMNLANAEGGAATQLPYAASAQWTLHDADGAARTVEARFTDAAGNVSAPAVDSIGLDRVAPTGTLTILGGRRAINRADVTVDLTWSDVGSGVEFVDLRDEAGEGEIAVAATLPYLLPAEEGVQTAAAVFRDRAGNTSLVAVDGILVDLTRPAGSITVNGGTGLAVGETLRVAADLAPGGSEIVEATFRTSVSQDGGPQPYVRGDVLEVPVPEGAHDGPLSVSVVFRDEAGNDSYPIVGSVYVAEDAPHDLTTHTGVKGEFPDADDVDAYALELQRDDVLEVSKVKAVRAPKGIDLRVTAWLLAPDGSVAARLGDVAAKPAAPVLHHEVAASGRHWLVFLREGADAAQACGYAASLKITFGKTHVVGAGASVPSDARHEAEISIPDVAAGRGVAVKLVRPRGAKRAPVDATLEPEGTVTVARDVVDVVFGATGDQVLTITSDQPFTWKDVVVRRPGRGKPSTWREPAVQP